MSRQCPRCGTKHLLADRFQEKNGKFTLERINFCVNRHTFSTFEVPASMLAQKKQRGYAVAVIERRIDLYQRNQEIKRKNSKASVAALADEFGLSETRIKQILKSN